MIYFPCDLYPIRHHGIVMVIICNLDCKNSPPDKGRRQLLQLTMCKLGWKFYALHSVAWNLLHIYALQQEIYPFSSE